MMFVIMMTTTTTIIMTIMIVMIMTIMKIMIMTKMTTTMTMTKKMMMIMQLMRRHAKLFRIQKKGKQDSHLAARLDLLDLRDRLLANLLQTKGENQHKSHGRWKPGAHLE